MNAFQTNYQALVSDESEAHAESLVIHVASEGSKSRWNHIDDLDSFFQKVYKFHQKYGFICIMGEEFVNLAMFMIIALFIVYCMRCIYFDFDAPTSPLVNKTDIQLADLFIPVSDCFISFNGWMWFIFLIVLVQIFVRLYKFFQTYISFKEIEQFYETALKIPKAEVHNVTWHEIQCKLREVQHEQQMCVYKSDLSELDIYHRILRKENYKVALINKGILPVKFKVKFLGDWIYFSSALEKNLDFLLFGYFSPFKTTGTLKEDYKKYSKRKEMAAQLAKWFLVFGVANLICSPIIFAWQFFSFFITYSGIVRYEPSFLGMRRWSSYSKLYFRHFNELDHELSSRLNRAYKPAQEYMKSFSSPLGAIIFNFCRQISGGIAVFFFVWGMFIESLMLMDHVLLLIAAGSAFFYIFSAMVPDENAVFSPKQLMQKIVAEIHYIPDHFKTMAHTTTVRDEFSQFFQYKVIFLLEELISPIVTPLILIFHLRHRALDIVDFFRCFTVDVAGVGDVCSFALMDVSKHGNQDWVGPQNTKADQIQQAEDGKTELSLIHFKLMNPYWKPPNPSVKFIDEFRDQVSSSRAAAGVVNPYYSSLNSISTMGSKYASLVNSIHQTMHPHTGSSGFKSSIYTKEHEHMNGGLTRAEGPPFLVQDGVLSSLPENVDGNCLIPPDLNPMEFRAVDMSLSALFLHEVHDKYKSTVRTLLPGTLVESSYSGENAGNEEAPLLDIKRTYVN